MSTTRAVPLLRPVLPLALELQLGAQYVPLALTLKILWSEIYLR